jgi:hypothetical protein
MKTGSGRKEDRLRDEQIMKALEEVAERLSVQVHYEEMKAFEFRVEDGSCRVKGEPSIFIDRKRPLKEKISILARELQKFDLEDIYVPPLLREKILLPHAGQTGSGFESQGTSGKDAVAKPSDTKGETFNGCTG